jgi:pimeloyl-ACP methyl ester carboxylesterase
MKSGTAGRRSARQETVEIDGRSVVYEVAGEGEPVILIHGLSGSARWWWRNLPALAENYRTFIVDLPGFGEMRSDRPGFRLHEAAEYLQEWIEQVDIGSAHIIGHSLGGLVSIQIAATRPDLVRCLVLVAPAGVKSERGILGYSIPLLRAATQLRPRFAAVLARDFLRAGPLTILRAANELLNEDVRPLLGEIEHPVLLIWGENDPMIPPAIGSVLRSELPNSRLLVLNRVGHVPMIDRSDEFNDAVIAFLRGVQVGD